MNTRRLTVTVPKPCHQDWAAMAPGFQGRFCQNCSKTVVDFTHMTDAEVVGWIRKEKGGTCGRFTQSQLARELVVPQSARSRWSWKALALGLVAGLGTKSAEASITPSALIEQAPAVTSSDKTGTLLAPLASDSSRVIKGAVIDQATGEPIPGVTIQLKGTTVATSTNENGLFSLDIPPSYQIENQSLVFGFIGYQDHEHKLNQSSFSQVISVKLALDIKGSFESVIVGGAHFSRWYTPRGLYNRVHTFFGHTVPQLFSRN